MKSLLIYPQKTYFKKPVKKKTAGKSTRQSVAVARGILNTKRNNCNRYMLYPGNDLSASSNKLVSNKDKFSLWQK